MDNRTLTELVKLAHGDHCTDDRVGRLQHDLNSSPYHWSEGFDKVFEHMRDIIDLANQIEGLLNQSLSANLDIEAFLNKSLRIFKAMPEDDYNLKPILFQEALMLLKEIEICNNIIKFIETEDHAKKFFELYKSISRNFWQISRWLLGNEEPIVGAQIALTSRHFESSSCLRLALKIIDLSIKMRRISNSSLFELNKNLSPVFKSDTNKHRASEHNEEIWPISAISSCILINAHASANGWLALGTHNTSVINVLNEKVIKIIKNSIP